MIVYGEILAKKRKTNCWSGRKTNCGCLMRKDCGNATYDENTRVCDNVKNEYNEWRG